MKYLFSLALLLSIISCKENTKSTTSNDNNKPTKSSVVIKELISYDSINTHIENYYIQKFSDQTVNKEATDDGVELTFSKNDGSIASIIYIPTNASSEFVEKAVIKGDLDKDGITDIVYTIHTEGEGTGANSGHNDIFIYLGGAYGVEQLGVFSDKELSGCDDRGYFIADTIINNELIGVSDCFQEGDANCCPSLHFKTILQLNKDKKLEQISKAELKK